MKIKMFSSTLQFWVVPCPAGTTWRLNTKFDSTLESALSTLPSFVAGLSGRVHGPTHIIPSRSSLTPITTEKCCCDKAARRKFRNIHPRENRCEAVGRRSFQLVVNPHPFSVNKQSKAKQNKQQSNDLNTSLHRHHHACG